MDQNMRDRLAFEFFFEERVWYLASVLKNFKLDKLQPKIVLKMQARLGVKVANRKKVIETSMVGQNTQVIEQAIKQAADIDYQMYDFTEALTEVMK